MNEEEKQMLTQISEWSGLTKADAIRAALLAYYDLAKSNKSTSYCRDLKGKLND